MAALLLAACLANCGGAARGEPAAPALVSSFSSGEVGFELAGESLADDALAPGRGYVRGAPLSNAFLKPGQNPRTMVETFSTSLRRPGPEGPNTLYRVKFRSAKHVEFRQLLFTRRVEDPASGKALLEYEVKVDGARTANGKEYWLTFEPNGLGEGDFSVYPHGVLDLERRRLDVTLLERLPGRAPRRFELAFAVDDGFGFTRVAE